MVFATSTILILFTRGYLEVYIQTHPV